MSQNRMELRGLEEFRSALRNLPEDLTHEAGAIVIAHAEQATREIQAGYPEGPTGNLKRGVTMERNSSKLTASAIVRSRAKHASIFERGTVARRTGRGVNRGRMPAAPQGEAMIPKVIRARARMVRALIDLVKRAGFEVDA